MPNSASARKRVRQNHTLRARNRRRTGEIKDAVKAFRNTIHAGDVDKAGTQLKELYKLLDQIASTKTIHKNTASRYKSRLTISLNKLKASKTKAA